MILIDSMFPFLTSIHFLMCESNLLQSKSIKEKRRQKRHNSTKTTSALSFLFHSESSNVLCFFGLHFCLDTLLASCNQSMGSKWIKHENDAAKTIVSLSCVDKLEFQAQKIKHPAAILTALNAVKLDKSRFELYCREAG